MREGEEREERLQLGLIFVLCAEGRRFIVGGWVLMWNDLEAHSWKQKNINLNAYFSASGVRGKEGGENDRERG